VLADRQRLHQILVNFVSNAIKYTPKGGFARVETTLVGDQVVRISVFDNGPGIPSDLLGRLFNPFERLGAEQGPVSGTGLGLAHSKALAERMGGRVGVDSTVGSGSSFWVEVPAAPALPARIALDAVADRSHLGATDATVTGTVLCIDDNPTNTRLLERVFEMRPSVRLRSAMLGRLGIELAREHLPDLIILDLHLPDISGEFVLRELRGDSRTAAIPVLIVSADASHKQIARLQEHGSVAHLPKPIDVARLLAMVDDHIRPRP